MLSVGVCQSQFREIERLPDKSIRIEIDGQQYLAITRSQLDAWQILQNNFDKCQADAKDLNTMIKESQLQRDLAIAREALANQKVESLAGDFAQCREDTKRNYSLFMSERDLRIGAQSFIPHSTVKGFWGKLLGAMDHPASQTFWKIGVPAYQMFRCK